MSGGLCAAYTLGFRRSHGVGENRGEMGCQRGFVETTKCAQPADPVVSIRAFFPCEDTRRCPPRSVPRPHWLCGVAA